MLLMLAAWNDGILEQWNVEMFPRHLESIIPPFQYSIIPFVSEANDLLGEAR